LGTGVTALVAALYFLRLHLVFIRRETGK
jgi:hypothetical protein